jgi:ribose 5-phosphate isomerase A
MAKRKNGLEEAKEAAAIAAVALIQEEMLVGLGTGSTAAYFISHLGEKCRQGLKIKAVATSIKSQDQAAKEGIPLIDINEVTTLDIGIDGADEIDNKKRLIKGGGGAAFREKVVASMCATFVIIADESKQVENLGKFPLAVEILPFGHAATISKLEQKGFRGKLRKSPQNKIFETDNKNYIFDITLSYPCVTPEKIDQDIKSVTGVIETGFFIDIASLVIIGFPDGHVETLS